MFAIFLHNFVGFIELELHDSRLLLDGELVDEKIFHFFVEVENLQFDHVDRHLPQKIRGKVARLLEVVYNYFWLLVLYLDPDIQNAKLLLCVDQEHVPLYDGDQGHNSWDFVLGHFGNESLFAKFQNVQ